MKPTYDELFALVQHQSKIVFEQQQTIRRLEKRVAQLEEQLKLNSKNSSKPPSSDNKGSSEPRKKGGAKPGHPGHFRLLFSAEQINQYLSLKTESCPACGNLVKQLDESPSIHQQVEISKKCFDVTQYERHPFYCPCCRTFGVAPLPLEIGASAFGTRLTAFMSFLSGTCRLGKRMVLRVLQEGMGIKACVGSVSNIEQRVSLALRAPYEEIAKEVRSSQDTKYIDETSWRQWGKREYLWVMSTQRAALYKIQNHRNAECRDELLGEAKWSKAAFVTDRFALYRFESSHQYCLAHLKRDLNRFAERPGLDGEWGMVMSEYLDKIFKMWKEVREEQRSRRSFQYRTRKYRDDFIYGLLIAAKKRLHSETLSRFARSLLRRIKNLFVFAEQEGIEPTNNQAERDLRHAVIWRKLCHGTKSDRGDRFVERIQSVIGTLLRRKEECLEFLFKAVDAMKRRQAAPSLLQQSC